jgi:hypothetical protein
VETLWVKTLVNILFTARGFLTWHVWMNLVFMGSGYALIMVRAVSRRDCGFCHRFGRARRPLDNHSRRVSGRSSHTRAATI